MDITIFPEKLLGRINAIPSKSQAHRMMLCAALADRPTAIEIAAICNDLMSTMGCITGFGAQIRHHYSACEIVTPISPLPSDALCNCGESGATLRFMLPLAGALGVQTVFLLEGRLPYRPLSPLWEELERHGCCLKWLSRRDLKARGIHLSNAVTAGLLLTGRLTAGHYRIDGNVSSQFISGLLMALPLLSGESRLELMGTVESRPYIDMTLQVLSQFGVQWDDYRTPGNQHFRSPGTVQVEGDWSSAAFWIAANALGSQISVEGLDSASVQGDKAITALCAAMEEGCSVSAADIPDLVPVLAVVAAAKKGAVLTDIRRLRLKESDRVASVVDMICSLGGRAWADENTLTVLPCPLVGGTVDAHRDHRIAMAAAVASTVCTRDVTILGAECVSKSYPNFWKEFTRLGGRI